MPLQADIGSGGPATTSGRVFLRQTIVLLPAAPPQTSLLAEVIGLPNLQFWTRQTAGVGTSVQFQISASSQTGVLVDAEFLATGPAVALPAGAIPLLTNFTISCRFARILVTPPALGCTVDLLILAAD